MTDQALKNNGCQDLDGDSLGRAEEVWAVRNNETPF